MTHSCFVYEKDIKKAELPIEEVQHSVERSVSEETYEAIKDKISYKEIAHKESHMVGAMAANLDDTFHLAKNTELLRDSVSAYASVMANLRRHIYTPYIADFLEGVDVRSISISRSGRKEKVSMTVGSKEQKSGIRGWDALKPHKPAEQEVDKE